MYLSVEYAGILDLNKSEEEILAGASQGFRRKLRKAEKNDIEITADASDTSIKEFCKLEKKHADLICANSIASSQTGFAVDTNQVTLISQQEVKELPLCSKEQTADLILDQLFTFHL